MVVDMYKQYKYSRETYCRKKYVDKNANFMNGQDKNIQTNREFTNQVLINEKKEKTGFYHILILTHVSKYTLVSTNEYLLTRVSH